MKLIKIKDYQANKLSQFNLDRMLRGDFGQALQVASTHPQYRSWLQFIVLVNSVTFTAAVGLTLLALNYLC